MMIHRSDIGRSVKEILRLVQAFRHSDLTGHALASGWIPGGEVIPTDFSEKVTYFTNKFGHGHGNKENIAKDENNKTTSVNKSVASVLEVSEMVESSTDTKQVVATDVHNSPLKDEPESASGVSSGDENKEKSKVESNVKDTSKSSSDSVLRRVFPPWIF